MRVPLHFLVIFFSFLSAIFSNSYSVPPANFTQAKKVARVLFSASRQTLYCQCAYDSYQQVDLSSCGMQEAHRLKRAQRIEWEHIMPAENFGRQFQCWREPICLSKNKPYKGRKCCEKSNALFRQAEAELYNLWPAVGLVNQARSNYRYSVLPGHPHFYGCAMRIDKKLRKAEPPDKVKGLVARAYLFMADRYQVRLSPAQRQLLMHWHVQFPPTAWEKAWAKQVEVIEGYQNPYIG